MIFFNEMSDAQYHMALAKKHLIGRACIVLSSVAYHIPYTCTCSVIVVCVSLL